jgi:hypothetical protein
MTADAKRNACSRAKVPRLKSGGVGTAHGLHLPISVPILEWRRRLEVIEMCRPARGALIGTRRVDLTRFKEVVANPIQ